MSHLNHGTGLQVLQQHMRDKDGGTELTLFLAGRNEVSFEEVYRLLEYALLGACAMRHRIDIGLDSPSALAHNCIQSCIIEMLTACVYITAPALFRAHKY